MLRQGYFWVIQLKFQMPQKTRFLKCFWVTNDGIDIDMSKESQVTLVSHPRHWALIVFVQRPGIGVGWPRAYLQGCYSLSLSLAPAPGTQPWRAGWNVQRGLLPRFAKCIRKCWGNPHEQTLYLIEKFRSLIATSIGHINSTRKNETFTNRNLHPFAVLF